MYGGHLDPMPDKLGQHNCKEAAINKLSRNCVSVRRLWNILVYSVLHGRVGGGTLQNLCRYSVEYGLDYKNPFCVGA